MCWHVVRGAVHGGGGRFGPYLIVMPDEAIYRAQGTRPVPRPGWRTVVARIVPAAPSPDAAPQLDPIASQRPEVGGPMEMDTPAPTIAPFGVVFPGHAYEPMKPTRADIPRSSLRPGLIDEMWKSGRPSTWRVA